MNNADEWERRWNQTEATRLRAEVDRLERQLQIAKSTARAAAYARDIAKSFGPDGRRHVEGKASGGAE